MCLIRKPAINIGYMYSLDRVTMTLIILSGVIVDVIDQNRTAIGTPEMVNSQMNFKRRSSILRLKLTVLLSEIDLQAIPMDRSEIGTIVSYDLDQSISPVPSSSSDDALINL